MDQGEDQVTGGASGPTSDELRADIERTRAELDETVDALGEKLRPANLANEGWQAVKTRSGRGALRLADVVREHPVASAAIGAGVAVVLLERARRRRAYEDDYEYFEASRVGEISDPDWGAGYAGPASTVTGQEGRSRARRARERVVEAAGGVKEKVEDMAGSVKDSVKERAAGVGRRAGDLGRRAEDLGRRVKSGAGQAREGFWDLLESRPLVAGAAAVAAGVLVGLAVPSTRREDELLGETRDEMLQGARDAGRRTFDKTKEVARTAAEAAQDAARSEAERQNLVGGTGGAGMGQTSGMGSTGPGYSQR